MSETIYDAFSEFSKKFARFKKSGESLPKRKSEDDFLQDKINAGEAARKQAVSKSYRIYRDPFGELGKTSERARAIYDDEQALLRAYNLFKAVTEASGGKSDKETFVSSLRLSRRWQERTRTRSAGISSTSSAISCSRRASPTSCPC